MKSLLVRILENQTPLMLLVRGDNSTNTVATKIETETVMNVTVQTTYHGTVQRRTILVVLLDNETVLNVLLMTKIGSSLHS
jgi:hypothetical protein